MNCTTCYGGKVVSGPAGAQLCPLCDGTGQEYDPGREFSYEIGPIIVAGGAAAQASTVQVLNRSFRWMMAVAQSIFPFSSQILDSRDQRPFSNQQVHSANLWGTAQNPMPLLTPFIFSKNSNILANITDLGGATGFANVTNGSPNIVLVSGGPFITGPSWVGQSIVIGTVSYTISAVPDQSHLTLAGNFQQANNNNIAFNVGNSIRLTFKGVELSDGSN